MRLLLIAEKLYEIVIDDEGRQNAYATLRLQLLRANASDYVREIGNSQNMQ